MPEPIDAAPAPLWRRATALGFDWLIVWTLFFAMQVTGLSFWVLRHSDRIDPAPWGTWFLALVTVAAFLVVLEVVYTAVLGQSPGKDVLGVRVVDDRAARSGGRWVISPLRAATRWALPGLAIVLPPPYAVVALAFIALPALVDPHRRTLADRVAGTRVVAADGARAAEARRRASTDNLMRYTMDKWVAGITSDPRSLPKPDTDVEPPDRD